MSLRNYKWIAPYYWFSHDVTKNSNCKTIDPTEILLSWCIKAAQNHYSYKFSLQMGSKLLRDAAFTWPTRELLSWLKMWSISGNLDIWTVILLGKYYFNVFEFLERETRWGFCAMLVPIQRRRRRTTTTTTIKRRRRRRRRNSGIKSKQNSSRDIAYGKTLVILILGYFITL